MVKEKNPYDYCINFKIPSIYVQIRKERKNRKKRKKQNG